MPELLIENFHFLRPEWFYGLIPAILLSMALRYRRRSRSTWEKAIDPAFLPYLLDDPDRSISTSPVTMLLACWVIALFALAGPVWEKKPQPVHEREDALVIVLDLTRSMYATDVKPNRLIRARRKLSDLLESRTEGVTGLVVFSGDAHTVSPLTDDTNTIAAMIPALSPEIMPAAGSQLAPALLQALQLFRNAGVTSGRILIITDEIRDVAEAQKIARENRHAWPVSVLSVGTPEGAPVRLPGPNGGYLKDSSGNLVIPKVDIARLSEFARHAGGRFSTMTLGDEDLAFLLQEDPLLTGGNYRELERDFDIWYEEGPWLLLLLLPLAAFAFRRGWLWGLALLLVLPVNDAEASFWEDLWLTRDQQGMQALEENRPGEAADLFENPAWKASAWYREGNYRDAANTFARLEGGDDQYNLGNALARQGKYEEAIKAYGKALELDPENEDAAFNKKLIEQLLSQQEEQDQQGEQDENQEGDEGDQQEKSDESGNDQEQDQEQNEKQQGQNDQQQAGDEQQQEEGQDQDGQDESEEPEARQMAEEDARLDEEEKQALQQWLRRVPDDPGGLLRRKFEQQHEEALRNGQLTRIDPDADW